jgi:hypothetical protein
MSQRDDEGQPQSPDLGEMVQEDAAETLVGPAGSDPLDAGYVPPDRPYALDDPQTNVNAPENLDGRLAREQPDIDPDDPGEAVAALEHSERAPRLTQATNNADGTSAESLNADGAGIDGGAASAEEASVHLEQESVHLEPE